MKIQNLSTIYNTIDEILDSEDWKIKYILDTDQIHALYAQWYLTSDLVKSAALDFEPDLDTKISFIWTIDKISIILNDTMSKQWTFGDPYIVYVDLHSDILNQFLLTELILNQLGK